MWSLNIAIDQLINLDIFKKIGILLYFKLTFNNKWHYTASQVHLFAISYLLIPTVSVL